MKTDNTHGTYTSQDAALTRMRTSYVIGPDGSPLTPANLPTGNERWTSHRKGAVVAAINGGLLSIDVACARYGLTVEELVSWQRAYMRHGLQGLRATRIREYLD